MRRWMVLLAMLPGCVTATDIRDTGKVHTIGYYTGSLGQHWYDGRFEDGAVKACKGGKYKVLEKSARPKTLADTPALIESDRFFWVVECI